MSGDNAKRRGRPAGQQRNFAPALARLAKTNKSPRPIRLRALGAGFALDQHPIGAPRVAGLEQDSARPGGHAFHIAHGVDIGGRGSSGEGMGLTEGFGNLLHGD